MNSETRPRTLPSFRRRVTSASAFLPRWIAIRHAERWAGLKAHGHLVLKMVLGNPPVSSDVAEGNRNEPCGQVFQN